MQLTLTKQHLIFCIYLITTMHLGNYYNLFYHFSYKWVQWLTVSTAEASFSYSKYNDRAYMFQNILFYFLLKLILLEFDKKGSIYLFNFWTAISPSRYSAQALVIYVLGHFSLPNITNHKHIQYLTKVILPSVQNSVGICKQIMLVILYEVS